MPAHRLSGVLKWDDSSELQSPMALRIAVVVLNLQCRQLLATALWRAVGVSATCSHGRPVMTRLFAMTPANAARAISRKYARAPPRCASAEAAAREAKQGQNCPTLKLCGEREGRIQWAAPR